MDLVPFASGIVPGITAVPAIYQVIKEYREKPLELVEKAMVVIPFVSGIVPGISAVPTIYQWIKEYHHKNSTYEMVHNDGKNKDSKK